MAPGIEQQSAHHYEGSMKVRITIKDIKTKNRKRK